MGRPAWMKSAQGGGEAAEEGTAMLGPFERSRWSEQTYARNLFLQARGKILKSKAFEVPEEMMTMTTGARPKWKPERREKDGEDDVAKDAEPNTREERRESKEPVEHKAPIAEEG